MLDNTVMLIYNMSIENTPNTFYNSHINHRSLWSNCRKRSMHWDVTEEESERV